MTGQPDLLGQLILRALSQSAQPLTVVELTAAVEPGYPGLTWAEVINRIWNCPVDQALPVVTVRPRYGAAYVYLKTATLRDR